ncbi:hypothetical protein [Nocardiopsis kunsanensis]|uniref:Uncharacterized protein n=1 Tax=Nocardiopsis kunsanensis TaxID=141693 RepID=A0A918XD55_9ACTN|nr:hypothetical protein [Nocardiopsis kunsanensis]GHD26753.1 hypothetical protein GCM10007147_25100 [Nocardiopsis kunsanensis]
MSADASGPTPEGSVAKLMELSDKPTPVRRLISWSSRPPGRLYIPACAVVGIALLYEDSVPGGHLPTFLFGLIAGLLLAGMGALRLGIALAVARPMIRYYWLRWISAPLVAAVAIGVAFVDIPLQTRVQASTEQLTELREQVDGSTTIPRNGKTTGLYQLHSVSVADGITHYEIENAGLFSPAGLAHSTEEIPDGVFLPGQGSKIYEHVADDWYVWVAH